MLIRVAVPVPALDLLTYRVPDGIAVPVVGARVVVPLGSRIVTGIVVDDGARRTTRDERGIKPIREVLDAERSFRPTSSRWRGGRRILRGRCRRDDHGGAAAEARGARADAHKTIAWRRSRPPASSANRSSGSRAAPRKNDVPTPVLSANSARRSQLLAGAPDGMPTPELAARGIQRGHDLRAWQALGLVSLRHERVDRDPFSMRAPSQTPAGEPRPGR